MLDVCLLLLICIYTVYRLHIIQCNHWDQQAEACSTDTEALARSLAFIFLNKSGKLKYAIIFSHKCKSIHNSELQIVLFVCTHNINKNV